MVKVAMEGEKTQQIKPIKPIDNGKARRVTYMKRKQCIMKKTMELATLCGIKALTVCFGPNGEVETWPENPSEARSIIRMYKEYGNGKGGHRSKKVIARGVKSERGLLSGWRDEWLHGLSREGLTNLLRGVEFKLQGLTVKIELLKMLNEKKNNQGGEIRGRSVHKAPATVFSCSEIRNQDVQVYLNMLNAQNNAKGKAIVKDSPVHETPVTIENGQTYTDLIPYTKRYFPCFTTNSQLSKAIVSPNYYHGTTSDHQLPPQPVEPTAAGGGGYFYHVNAQTGYATPVWPLNYYGEPGISGGAGDLDLPWYMKPLQTVAPLSGEEGMFDDSSYSRE